MFNQYKGLAVANAIVDYHKAVCVIQWLLDNNMVDLKGNTIEDLATEFAGKKIVNGLSNHIDFSE